MLKSTSYFSPITHFLVSYRSKFGGLEVNDVRRLKALEDENRRLKQIVADLTLDNQALKALSQKNF